VSVVEKKLYAGPISARNILTNFIRQIRDMCKASIILS